jgi:uncharacterized protein YciI
MKYLVLAMRNLEFDPAMIPAHYEFLDGLRANGMLEQSGPFTDSSGGAYVLLAQSAHEAWSLAKRDPLHVSGCSTITVREWNAK